MLQGKYVGSQRFHNNAWQGAYTVHNLGMRYKHSDQRSFQMDIYNAFDKSYSYVDYSKITGDLITVPRGRNIYLSYKIKF